MECRERALILYTSRDVQALRFSCSGDMHTRIDVAVCVAILLPCMRVLHLWYARVLMQSVDSDGKHIAYGSSSASPVDREHIMQWYIESMHVAAELEDR